MTVPVETPKPTPTITGVQSGTLKSPPSSASLTIVLQVPQTPTPIEVKNSGRELDVRGVEMFILGFVVVVGLVVV